MLACTDGDLDTSKFIQLPCKVSRFLILKFPNQYILKTGHRENGYPPHDIQCIGVPRNLLEQLSI